MRKNALIIGGSSGIGLATVKKLASHDFNLYIVHRDRRQSVTVFQETIDAICQEYAVEIQTFNADATNESKIANTINKIKSELNGQFDLLLHAISRGNLKPFVGKDSKLMPQDLILTIEAMGTSLHTWVSQLLEVELLAKGGRIVSLTSEGNKRFWNGYGAVAIAKSALETMVNYFAVELASMKINANIIQAGVTDTPSLRLIPDSDQLIEDTKNRNPHGRMTTPQDVANAIYLLTLPEARWINGGIIHVDGGEHLL